MSAPAPACPSCGTTIQPTWDWCYKCGFDPDGLRPTDIGPAKPPQFDEPGAPGPTSPSPAVALPAAAPDAPASAPPGPTGPPAGGPPFPGAGSQPTSGYPPFGPPKADRSNALTIGIGVVALAVLAIGAIFVVNRSTQPPPVNDDSADGTPNALAKNQGGARIVTTTTEVPWTTFSPPGAGFSADLPGTPSERSRTMRTRDGVTTKVFQYTVGEDETTGAGVGYFDLPAGYPFDTEILANNLAALYGGAAKDIVTVNYAGLEGVDFTGLSQLSRIRERILKAGNRVDILFAGRPLADTTGSEVDFIKLTNSLKIG